MRANKRSFIFALILSVIVSIILAFFADFLKEPQALSYRLDIIKNIFSVVGYEEKTLEEWKLTPEGRTKMIKVFHDKFEVVLIDKNNEEIQEETLIQALVQLNYIRKDLEGLEVFEILQLFNSKLSLLAKKEKQDKESYDPKIQLIFIYKTMKDGKEDLAYIVPVEGYGLWDMIYSYIAFESDLNRVRDIRFYDHKETPGLGGECSKPWFTNQFKEKEILNEEGKFQSISVVKGKAKDMYKEEELKHYVDGMSGGTITGNGITKFLAEDLKRYNSYFSILRQKNKENIKLESNPSNQNEIKDALDQENKKE